MVITEKMLSELKEEYEKHKNNPDTVFLFYGKPLLISYAKYLIQFLEAEFKEVKNEQVQSPRH